jgi:hypothetical protein
VGVGVADALGDGRPGQLHVEVGVHARDGLVWPCASHRWTRRCDRRLPGTVKVEQAVSGSRRGTAFGETARLGPSHLGGPPVECGGGGVAAGLIRR